MTTPSDRGFVRGMTRFYPEDLAEIVRNATDVHAKYEEVIGRDVRCSVPEDDCPERVSVWYARIEGGGHGHYRKYETPHRRLVIRLPAEPGSAR